jgi:uncharacterized membrane-anchored protein
MRSWPGTVPMTNLAPPLLADHPLRAALNDEVHARPPEALRAPLIASFLAMYSPDGDRAAEWAHLARLAEQHGVHLDGPPRIHLSLELGAFRLRFERHSEFARYKFIVTGDDGGPFERTALSRVPADWVAALAGKIMVATHVSVLKHGGSAPDYDDLAARCFDGNTLIAAEVGDGAAIAMTDFRVRADRFGRLLLIDRSLTPRQLGRMLQRLLEIDSYRMMALLALPVARELAPFLTRAEAELTAITASLGGAREQDEPQLLERLTQLGASIESRIAVNDFRFGAAAAYWGLVQQRIADLREVRIPGLQTFREFIELRLAPAMNTCRTMEQREESLSARTARANQLLATRVDISHERQNQALLESMNRRASVQLRLQQTVEGLSVAAVTYYAAGLVGYCAKGLKAAGMHLDPEITVAICVPILAAVTALGVARIHRMVQRSGH